MPTTDRAEVVIVGAGVIGMATAFELLERGREVLLLERDRPGAGCSRCAAGMLAPVSEAEIAEPELVALGRDSLERYPDFVQRVESAGGGDCGYRAAGTLWVAINRDNREEIERLHETLRLKGLPATPLGPAELSSLEPHLSGRASFGLRVEGDHRIDPRALCCALERAVRSRGGRIADGVTVSEIHAADGRVERIEGRDRGGAVVTVACERVVLAAGSWSFETVRTPLSAPGLRPVKGQLVRLRGPRLLEHAVRTPDVYLVPQPSGELLLGGTMEEMGFDVTPTAGAVSDLLRRGWELLPGIYDMELAEVSVGLRPATADHLPRIGPTAIDGLYLAVGHYRHGILLAAATAAHLADVLDGNGAQALHPFSPLAESTERRSEEVR